MTITSVVLVTLIAIAGVSAGIDGGVSPEFLATSLVVVVLPGTGVVYTVSSALGGGWRRGLLAAVGCTLGIVPHMTAAMLGLSGVMQAGATVFELVRWAGVAYLVFMGVSVIRGGQFELDADPDVEPLGAAKIVRRGIVLNLLNPKLTVFFFAFLPQFLETSPALIDPRLIGLGVIFMLLTLVVFIAYAWASAAVRERVLGAPRMVAWIQRSLGGLLVVFAARLATAER